MGKKYLKYSIFTIVILMAISFLLSIKTSVPNAFRIVFGMVYLLFLPGFIWSFVFFRKREISFIERFTISIAMSIIISPLFIYILNKIGLKITTFIVFFEILGIIILGCIFLVIEYKKEKRINLERKNYAEK